MLRLRDYVGDVHILGEGATVVLEQEPHPELQEHSFKYRVTFYRDAATPGEIVFRGRYADCKNVRRGIWDALKGGKKSYDLLPISQAAEAAREQEATILVLADYRRQRKPEPTPELDKPSRKRTPSKPKPEPEPSPKPRKRKPRVTGKIKTPPKPRRGKGA